MAPDEEKEKVPEDRRSRKRDSEGRVKYKRRAAKTKSDSEKKPRGVRGEQVEGGGIRCKHCGLVCADGKEAKRHRAYFHYRTKKCPHCDFLGHADKVGVCVA